MKRALVFLGIVLMTIGPAGRAQEVNSTAPLQESSWGDENKGETTDYIPEVRLDSRWGVHHHFSEHSGRFDGDGLYINIDGKINSNLSYSFNHTLATAYSVDHLDGYAATNWLTLTYETDNWYATVGKQSMNVGNFEYDADFLDAYYPLNSMFYNMIESWLWGVSGGWYAAEGHEIILQFTNSPLRMDERNRFAYSLAWRGEWEHYMPYWSANLWQTDCKEYVSALNFGNRFLLGNLTLDLEYMTRAASTTSLFKDNFNVMVAPAYNVSERLKILGKFGWEYTAADLPYELAYEEYSGGDYFHYGGGFEFYPFKDIEGIRLHAIWAGNNFGDSYAYIGFRWNFDLTNGLRTR
jgi:hypothetical protein